MARPLSKLSEFILSLPRDLPAKQVMAAAKAKGLKATESNIYRVRRLGTPKQRPAPSAPTGRGSSPSSRGVGASGGAEQVLRAVAAELGLAHAIELLTAQRAKVRSLLGG